MDEQSEWVQKRKQQAAETNGEEFQTEGTNGEGAGHGGHDTHRGTFGGTTTPPDERRPKPANPQLVKVPVQPGEPPLELRSQIQVYATNE